MAALPPTDHHFRTGKHQNTVENHLDDKKDVPTLTGPFGGPVELKQSCFATNHPFIPPPPPQGSGTEGLRPTDRVLRLCSNPPHHCFLMLSHRPGLHQSRPERRQLVVVLPRNSKNRRWFLIAAIRDPTGSDFSSFVAALPPIVVSPSSS